ncbi:putative Se/S carrier-like protein [Brevibacillus dissolubilis]|uniref:putative Se/S carrier-like protein n=1 Tax=Brevibacillus dissolubilis TaxID=1844116 RepID=UPI003F654BD2
MLLEYADIDIDTRPTPKEITAGCALSIEFPYDQFGMAYEIVVTQDVVVRGFFRLYEGHYQEIDEHGERRM